MARAIKFRAWDSLEKRFTSPESRGQGHYSMSLDGRFFNLQNGSGGDEYVVQQFTGRQDLNGKDVYEGDLVIASTDPNDPTSPSGIAEVVWMDDPARVKAPQWGLYFLLVKPQLQPFLPPNVEVVGDIFSWGFEKIRKTCEERGFPTPIKNPTDQP
jgi:hypothetical protein